MLKKDEYYKLEAVPSHCKPFLMEGMIGIRADERNFNGQIALIFENKPNPRSQYGWFYIPEQCLKRIKVDSSTVTELTTGGVIAMNNNNKPLTKMDGNYNVAIIKFLDNNGNVLPNSPEVEYACYDKSVEVEDLVVCRTAHHGITVGVVVGMFSKNEDRPIYREIIDKVNTADWKGRIETRRQRAELIKQMQRRADELKEISLFETLAKADPKMAELLREYNGMTQEVSTNEGKDD